MASFVAPSHTTIPRLSTAGLVAPSPPSKKGPKAVLYPGDNADFMAARSRCGRACAAFNTILPDAPPATRALAWLAIVSPDSLPDDAMMASAPPTPVSDTAPDNAATFDWSSPPPVPFIKAPIQVDYGLRLRIPPTTFINYGCVILDTPVADVRIGEHCLIGPNCTIISVSHPIHPHERGGPSNPSTGAHVIIGDHVWFGASVTVLPGVTIGTGSVIGAGSVVTRDIPPYSVAVGNPARVIRSITDGHCTTSSMPMVGTLAEALSLP